MEGKGIAIFLDLVFDSTLKIDFFLFLTSNGLNSSFNFLNGFTPLLDVNSLTVTVKASMLLIKVVCLSLHSWHLQAAYELKEGPDEVVC